MNVMAMLSELGYNVTGIAFSGDSAISMAHQDKPDVVLMEIQLIGAMDGRQAARKIRDKFDVPVVFVARCGDKHASRSVKPPEGYGYLVMPLTKSKLAAAIEGVLPDA